MEAERSLRIRPMALPSLMIAGLLWGLAVPASSASDSALRGGAGAARGSSESPAEAADGLRAEGRAPARDGLRAAARSAMMLAERQQAQGDYGLAVETLDRALEQAASQGGDAALIAALRGARGNLYIAVASPEEARRELEAALALAQKAGARHTAATIWNNLGNHFASVGESEAALDAYRSCAREAQAIGDAALVARAFANAARVMAEAGDEAQSGKLVASARRAIEALPETAEKSQLLIHLARTLALPSGPSTSDGGARDPGASSAEDRNLLERHALLSEAEAMAARQGDSRSASYALGYLAELYALRGRDGEALELTQRAILAARRADAPEIRYAWHAQAGRILESLGRRDEAIAEYAAAVELLQELRHTLAHRYGAASRSFGETLGPIYLEYVDLLLRRAATSAAPDADLELAQQVLERSKAAELRDYFKDECVDETLARRVSAAEASPSAAVVYPVLLRDRIEILVSIGSRTLRRSVAVGVEQATPELLRFRRLLETRVTRRYLEPARRIYGWLIEPIRSELEEADVDSLVFVPDGALRLVPMAALHDGERFLIERYAIAITPGLRLTDPRPLDREAARVFAGGLSEGVQGHVPLPYVEGELEGIVATFEGTLLLDEEFQRARVERELRNEAFSIVHIASHASFAENAASSYVLTHEGRLSMDDLSRYVGLFRFRDQPLDLLMLSACETAAGDERSGLGLSGLAIKAGARSAVGTLWSVNDEAASELVRRFYAELREPGRSRAEALRRAQLALLAEPRFRHPAYWSPFVLISNWL